MNLRALEVSIEISAFTYGLNMVFSPFNWRMPLLAVGKECWSQGSYFHFFVGPFHIYSRKFDLYTMNIGIDFKRNSFWWDKPKKKAIYGE